MKYNILKYISLIGMLAVFSNLSIAQKNSLYKSTEYKSFFQSDYLILLKADTLAQNGDKLLYEADTLLNYIAKLELRAEGASTTEKMKLRQDIAQLQRKTFDTRVKAYDLYQRANYTRYTTYDKFARHFWTMGNQDDLLRNKQTQSTIRNNFERANALRKASEKFDSQTQLNSIKTADSLENDGIKLYDSFLVLILDKPPSERNTPRFRDTEQFRILMKAELKKLRNADSLAIIADSMLRNGDLKHKQVRDMRIAAQTIKRKGKQRRALDDADKAEKKAYEQQFKAFDMLSQCSKQKYGIYHKYLIDFRVKAAPERIVQAVKDETAISRNWEYAAKLKTKLPEPYISRYDTLRKVDSLEKDVITRFEEVIGIYNDYDRIKNDVDIQLANDVMTKSETYLNALMDSFPSERRWTTEVYRYHQEIPKLRHEAENAKTKEMRDMTLQGIERYEQSEIGLIERQIPFLETSIKDKYDNYQTVINEIGRLVDNENIIAKAAQIEKRGLDSLMFAKQKIQEAFTQITRLKTKLPNVKTFKPLEVIKFRNEKCNIEILMLEAIGLMNSSDIILAEYENYAKPFRTQYVPPVKNDEDTKEESGNNNSGKKKPSNKQPSSDYIFKIQVASFDKPRPFVHFAKLDTTRLTNEQWNNGIAVVEGKYTYEDAQKALLKAQKAGYTDAFIVAYHKGKRILLNQALEEMKASASKNKPDVNTKTPKQKPEPSVTYTKQITQDKKKPNAIVTSTNLAKIKALVFTVQIAYSDKPLKSKDLNDLRPVFTDTTTNGTIRYNIGIFEDEAAAKKAKDLIESKYGLKDVTIAAYNNGKRIDIDQANELAKNRKSKENTKETRKTTETDKDEIVFQVQIAAGSNELSPTEREQFNKLTKYGALNRYIEKDVTYYSIGNFDNLSEASKAREGIIKEGIKDAFVVAFIRRERISPDKAQQLLNNRK